MKNGFSVSFRVLAVTLLSLSIFLPRDISKKAMMVFMALWLVIVFIGLIIRFKKDKKKSPAKKKCSDTTIRKNRIKNKFAKTKTPATGSESIDGDTALMLLHLSLRIREKLKSAYPDAVWK